MWLRMIFLYPLIVDAASFNPATHSSAYAPRVGTLLPNFSFCLRRFNASCKASFASSVLVNPERVRRRDPISGYSGSLST